MAQTQQEVDALIDALIIDNNTQQINPAKVRAVTKAINARISVGDASSVDAVYPLVFDPFTNTFYIDQVNATFHPIRLDFVDTNTFTLPTGVRALDVRPNGTSSDINWTQPTGSNQLSYLGTLEAGDFLIVVGQYRNLPVGEIPDLEMVANQGSSSSVNIQTPYAVDPEDLTPLGQVMELISEIPGGGGGAVDSVNGYTGDVELDADDIAETATRVFLTPAEKTQIGLNLDRITDLEAEQLTQNNAISDLETDVAALANGMVYKGNWDASAGTFPGSGVARVGWFYYVNVAGTVGGIEFSIGDNIVAIVDNASTTVYASNWSKHDQTDAVQSVAGLMGTITAAALRTALEAETTSQLNTRDTNNRNRANHSGTQLAATISDFYATVRATVLTGFSTASATVVSATDTVLGALGKLQAQLVLKEDKIFDINDSTLSAGVSSTSNVLIKTYDIGFLSGFKTVYVETLGFKSVVATGDFRFTIFLKEKLSATSYQLATSSGSTTSQHVVSVLRFAIDEPNTLIRLLNPALNTPTYLGNVVSNVSTYIIDFTKEYEIQVFLRVGDVAVEAKQYFNQIRKR